MSEVEDSFGWDYVAALRFPFLRGPSSTKSKSASAGADADFSYVVDPYESKLSTALRHTIKKRSPKTALLLLVVIRLGLAF